MLILYFDTNMQNTYHSLQTTLARRASKGLFNAPATAIDTATAGRVTSTLSTPRQFQFGVKFDF